MLRMCYGKAINLGAYIFRLYIQCEKVLTNLKRDANNTLCDYKRICG